MKEGFLLDTSGAMGRWLSPSAWVEGPPEHSVWTNIKTRGKTQYPVGCYRCESCGLLKLYALNKWA